MRDILYSLCQAFFLKKIKYVKSIGYLHCPAKRRTSPEAINWLFDESLSKANFSSDRYVYPVYSAFAESPIIPYPDWKFRKRPRLSLPRSFASTLLNGLSRRNCKTFYSLFKLSGLKGWCFFISVQAMISIFAASLTRILVLIPRSRSRPFSAWGQTLISAQFHLLSIMYILL